MFEKMKTIKTVQKVQTHVQENKQLYIVGASCLTVGIVMGVILKRTPQPIQIVNTVSPNISPVFNNTNDVTLGGYITKIVKDNETGHITETVTDMAKYAGVPFAKMSRHLNGHIPDINGKVYSIIGLGTSGEKASQELLGL